MSPKKIVIISGPTAIGKSKTALALAKKFNGELISADSRQVYSGMDIVTGKDIHNSKFTRQNEKSEEILKKLLGKEIALGTYDIEEILLWGLDLVNPDQSFDVSGFISLAKVLINNITRRGKLPIIVGGTAFYIHSLIYPYETIGVPINHNLRHKLETLTLSQLQNKLQKLDKLRWEKMNHSDANNPRRLIRALEVAEFRLKTRIPTQTLPKYLPLWFGLDLDKKELEKKIIKRVKARAAAGAEKEVRQLIKKGYSWELPSMSAIGYRDWRDYIEAGQNQDTLISQWAKHEIQYAKRQLTFLKKEKKIEWVDVNKQNYLDMIKLRVQKWLKTR